MSSNNLKTTTSTKTPRGIRVRRSSASLNGHKHQERALWKLLELTNFLLETGSLSNFAKCHETTENVEELISVELGVKLQVKEKAARTLMKLRDLIFNDAVWSFLRESSYLAVFSDFHFTKPYGTIKNDGGTLSLSLDFIEAFLIGESRSREGDHLPNPSKARKVDIIALSYSHEARDLIVTMFMKSVAAVSTLCSFIPETGNITWSQIMDVIARYTSNSWDSEAKQRQYHHDASTIHLLDGWHIVNEVYKIQVQELYLQKSSSGQGSASSSVVQIDDVKANVCDFTKHVVCELLAWCVVFLRDCQREEPTETLLETLDEMHEKLSKSMGVEPTEENTIEEEYVKNLINSVAQNQPTMAEVKYDSKEMTPRRRETRLNFSKRAIVWRTGDIFMRCRWEGSSAMQKYQNFLEAARQEDEKRIEMEPQKAEKAHLTLLLKL